MDRRKVLRVVAGGLLVVSSFACGPAYAAPPATQARVYVQIGPPAPIVERRVVAPGPGYFWVAGYHTWNGRAYAWVPGRWERVPPGHTAWVSGHWAHEKRGYYWVNGHWR
jgi:hypothetical protein